MPKIDCITLSVEELEEIALILSTYPKDMSISIIVDDEIITIRDIDGFKIAQTTRKK